jgi:NitT/TauT family transport system substrate-binding protein
MKRHPRGLCALALMGVLGTLSVSAPAALAADKVAYGVLPFTALAPVQIGVDRGIFSRNGINLQKLVLRQSTDSIPNLLSGRQQIGNLQPSSVQLAVAQGVKIKIIAPVMYSGADNQLWVKSSSKIRSIKDLKGKKIGVALLTGTATAGLLQLLQQNGIKKSQVNLVAAPVAQAAAMLTNGQVDAAQVLEPFATSQGSRIRAVVPDLYAPFGKHAITGYHVTTEAFAKSHPATVRKWVKAINQANQLARANSSLVRLAAVKLAGVPASTATRMKLPVFGTDMQLDRANRMAAIMKQYGFLTKTVDFKKLYFK